MPVVDSRKALAAALGELKKLQDQNLLVIESAAIKDATRKVLVDAGYLQPVIRGWYICVNPAELPGDTTAWYASFWPFISGYLGARFGEAYCLNPEGSVLLQTGNTRVPSQVTVVTSKGGSNVVKLPFDHSLLLYKDTSRIPPVKTVSRDLQVWSIPEAMCLVGGSFYVEYPNEAQIAIQTIRDVSEVLPFVLQEKTTRAAAERLAGAFEFMERKSEAARILKAISTPTVTASAQNPFVLAQPTIKPTRERSPYVLRIRAMWEGWRQDVINTFPSPPGTTPDVEGYLARVEDRYSTDAYNSLSIEGYKVTDELIARVARGDWSPDLNDQDRQNRDTLAARGYYQAFNVVKASVRKVLEGQNPGNVAKAEHHDWLYELFEPSVATGILEQSALLGYRTGPVYLRNSQHTPVPREAILDSLDELWRLIAEEPHAGVRAVLGHHLFVFIHPYYDGNGRCGRFLMNVLLASGGYPWTVVRLTSRSRYMAALEQASVAGDIKPLAAFIRDEMLAEGGDRP